MMNKGISEIWINVSNNNNAKGVMDWSKNQEIEPTLEMTSC